MSEYSTTGSTTSARLAETQQALAASQADLTRVEAERDAACALAVELLRDSVTAQREREAAVSIAEFNEGAANVALNERDLARAELASARQEIDQLAQRLAAARHDLAAVRHDITTRQETLNA